MGHTFTLESKFGSARVARLSIGLQVPT
jgi:hypothetical protein